MANLHLDDTTLNSIAVALGLPSGAVEFIYHLYINNIDNRMEKQYLAHSIRAVEEFCYERGRRVHIRHRVLKGCRVPICFDYVGKESTVFRIYYPEFFEGKSKTVRMSIAHEIGHLFFNTHGREECSGNKITAEDTANIFGLFILLGRSALYAGKVDVFGDASEEEVAREYAQFCEGIRS